MGCRVKKHSPKYSGRLGLDILALTMSHTLGYNPAENRGINLDDIPDFNLIGGVSKLLKAQFIQTKVSMQLFTRKQV